MDTNNRILTGNTFPMGMIRRKVIIEPVAFEEYRDRLALGNWESFWGHENTLAAVNAMTGYDLTPYVERPAIQLSENLFPFFNGKEYKECWILSPNYRIGFRPAIGVEVSQEDILSWNILKIIWK